MKNQTTKFLREVWTIMGAVLEAKTSAVKSKAAAVRARLIVLGLLRNKKFLFSTISHKFHALLKHGKDDDQASDVNKISHKFQALLGHRKSEVSHVSKISQKIHALLIDNEKEREDCIDDERKTIVIYNPLLIRPPVPEECCDDLADDEYGDDYPDLTHCLFDSEDLEDPTLSVVEIVKQSKDPLDEFILEDEIDRVADLFIKRFHRQMKMQKQESFKV